MPKSIRLQGTKDRFYRGRAHYYVVYDYAAGRPNRYNIWLKTTDDPVTIGRELDLPTVRELIAEFEAHFSEHTFFGDRRSAIIAASTIFRRRIANLDKE